MTIARPPAPDPTPQPEAPDARRSAAAIALALALVVGCGDAAPTSPSPSVVSAPLASSAPRHPAAAIGAFATASDTATLKVTAPVPRSPIDDVVVEGQRAILTVSGAEGRFVEASTLRLGFAISEVGNNGNATLIEASDVPQLAGTTTSYAVETVLAHDTLYRWRGRAILDGAYGPWSAWASFRTAPPPPPPTPELPSDPQARYIAIFEADWSGATHPQDFPEDPHFSPMIGATHLADTRFWYPGALASAGIERMAELGSQSPLDTEIAAAQA